MLGAVHHGYSGSMSRHRFEFALHHVTPTLWESFEHLASTFLADEYPSLRTLAGIGDRGRDAVLWQPANGPSAVLQFSITKKWSDKIRDAAKTIRKHSADARVLIYVTNLRIGPKADSLRSAILEQYDLFLDIRDRTWFLERQNRSQSTISAAEAFSAPIVDTLLATDSLIDRTPAVLNAREARIAVVFLAMQWEDDSREKGLTKICFEALVKAALRETDSDRRLSRAAICRSVRSAIQFRDPAVVDKHTNLALARLTKRGIRHWQIEDEFCLSFEERERRIDTLAKLKLLEIEMEHEILILLKRSLTAMALAIDNERLSDLVPYVRRVIARFMLRRGEAFAQSVSAGTIVQFTVAEIEEICVTEVTNSPLVELRVADINSLMCATIEDVLVSPSPNIQRYLRAFADGYTLFAFLRQVPDAQRAVRKIFSNGRVWLDTSAVLPLLAERLLDEEERSYTRTLKAARRAGIKLYVTPGVIEELSHHIRLARLCQEYGPSWHSRTPFLFSAYLWSGRPAADFKNWTVDFIGAHQPLDDMAEFLLEVAEIERRSLAAEVRQASDGLRWSVVRYWEEVHQRRSEAADSSRDPEIAKQLAEHDVENFLGVVMARQSASSDSTLGHTHWWLTLDRRAYRAAGEICEQEGRNPFDSPVMSYDFLVDYVALGPRRADISKAEERLLPLMLDMSRFGEIPEEFLEIADQTRNELTGMSERLVRREIRDRLNQARLRSGPIARGGMDIIEQDLREAFNRGPMPPP